MYDSRFYRVNLYWEGDHWRVRDLHIFDENYAERYLKNVETFAVATYDTLPLVDGFHWSQPGDIAGITAVSGPGEIETRGVPVVKEIDADSLLITCDLAAGGRLAIRCDPEQLRFKLDGPSAPAEWALQLRWAAEKTAPVAGVSAHSIDYRHEGFAYSLKCGDSAVTRNGGEKSIRIGAADGTVSLSFAPEPSNAGTD